MRIVNKALAPALMAALLSAGALAAPAMASASSAPARVPAATAESSTCLWQYVVTDGVPNNVRIFSGLDSTTVVGQIEPNQYFESPGFNVESGSQGARLQIDAGWVNFGDWLVLQGCS